MLHFKQSHTHEFTHRLPWGMTEASDTCSGDSQMFGFAQIPLSGKDAKLPSLTTPPPELCSLCFQVFHHSFHFAQKMFPELTFYFPV